MSHRTALLDKEVAQKLIDSNLTHTEVGDITFVFQSPAFDWFNVRQTHNDINCQLFGADSGDPSPQGSIKGPSVILGTLLGPSPPQIWRIHESDVLR